MYDSSFSELNFNYLHEKKFFSTNSAVLSAVKPNMHIIDTKSMK